MDTFLILVFFVLVMFFGFFYGSKKAMIVTLLSLTVIEIYMIFKIFYHSEGPILPVTIFGIFIIGYFLFIFNLIRYYIKKNEDQYIQFKGYYDDAVKKYEMLEKEEGSLKERNAKLNEDLDEVISSYENIKKITSTLDFENKLELMAGFISSIDEFVSGKLILIDQVENEKKIGNVINIKSGTEPQMGNAGEITEEDRQLGLRLLDGFEKNNKSIFVDIASSPVRSEPAESSRDELRGVVKGDFKTIGIIPMVNENEIMGFIAVFDAQMKSFEKIQALVPQLSMELKKIKLYEKVRELSIIDSLTGLYLRRHFMEILESEIERATRNKQPL